MSIRSTPTRLLTPLLGALILAACASQANNCGSTKNTGTGSNTATDAKVPEAKEPDSQVMGEHYLQVLEKGRVSVQLRADNLESCQRLRKNMLSAAEKASPGKGAKEMSSSVICSNQAKELAFALKQQNLAYQFASRDACEHYAIVKGLYPPRPAPGNKSPCTVAQVRKG